uniref:TPR_REGION domain-containing protein n=1 Tax=Caenorhabditis tropicalis TaxID=1561998 RepID=A0A1I7U864_9PELO
MSADRNFSTPVQNQTSLSRIALLQQAAQRSGALPQPGQLRHSKLSPFDVSQMSGVSISMVERAKINRQEFVDELEWLRRETTSRCFLDAELWTNELLAYMPDKWCSPTSLGLYSSHSKPNVHNISPSSLTSPPQGQATRSDELPNSKKDYISKFALTLIRNKEFRRAADFLKKTMKTNKLDKFLHYRSLFLAYYQEHLENDSEGVERKTSYAEEASPFGILHEQMIEHKLREDEDVWFEYLMGLIEVQLGLKSEAEKSMKSVITREPRLWPAWEALSAIVRDIEDADNFSSNSGVKSVWMNDWFMVLVLQRFHQDSMAIQKAEQLVTRGMTGIPMIITKIAACSNARHDHDQAIANFSDIRKIDPYRLADLHLFSDSLYIRSDQKTLSELALEMFKVQKFRWETCCIVANYHALRRDSELAIKFFQRALRLNPSLAALWVLIGHEFMEMKNNAAACVSYRRAIEIDPADHRGWYGLGQMYDIMKMPAYSLFYYQEAQKCKPHDSRLLVALGDIYSKLTRIEDAEKCFTGAYLFGDVEGNALWNLAKLHEKYSVCHKAAQVFEVFLVVYENVTSAEDKIIYAVAFLANYFFSVQNLEKAAEFATKCMAYETLCQEGNRLFREIAKVHEREGLQSPDSQIIGEGTVSSQQQAEQRQQEGSEEEMSEGEDDLSF